jgi:nucleotide-binding universal stress UspA family protein
MTFLVPYDGSDLSRAALVRAVEYGDALGEPVTVTAVLPEDDWGYARTKRWVGEDEAYDPEAVEEQLTEEVRAVDEDVSVRTEVIAEVTPGRVARRIESVASEVCPSVVFLGSENAGQIVTPISSVGSEVAADAEYDVHVVRHWSPTLIQELQSNPELYPGEVGR